VATGLPQAWPGSALGSATIRLFGGIGSMRFVHRVTGVIFVVLMVLHLAKALATAIRKRRLPIMALEKKDFLDAYQTLRHYTVGEPKPRSGKFDFREKFEYWGLLLGGSVMTVTGLVLLFPELASQVIPGILLAASRVAHGLEATFAVLVVILWHSYGVIFRPEVFPMDTSMITGKISLDRLKEEHGLEYERLFPEEPPALD
jgi:thiosulfate reductase cytochrome b subunit